MQKKVLWVVAGSSGGHILPANEIARRWKKKNPEGEVLFFTGTKSLEKNLAKRFASLGEIIFLPLLPFPRKKVWCYPHFFLSLIKTIKIISRCMKKQAPSLVVATGGYLCVPVVFVARRNKIHTELYEFNVEPGRAVSFLAPWSHAIFHTFSKTKEYFLHRNQKLGDKCRFISYPLRSYKKGVQKKNTTQKHLLILGGSQGSLFINGKIKAWIQTLSAQQKSSLFITHQTGKSDSFSWDFFYKEQDIKATVFSFTENLEEVYQSATHVIARAGAGTLAELQFFEKKSLIIPLRAVTTHHQVANAYEAARECPNIFSVIEQDVFINQDIDEFLGV